MHRTPPNRPQNRLDDASAERVSVEEPMPRSRTSPHLVDALDLGAVRLLLAVRDLGSVAKGARRVGISQPSATVKLRRLESLLGVPLLERSVSGSSLTTAGVLAAEVGKGLLAQGAEVFSAAEAGRGGNERVTIAATRSIALLRLAGLLANVDLGGAAVDVIEGATRDVAGMVRTGQAVVGLVDGPFAPLGLRSKIVGSFRLVAVAHRDHRLASATSVATPDLMQTDLIVTREGSGTRDVIEAAFASSGFGTQGHLVEVDALTGVVASASTGRGVGLIPADHADDLCADGHLVELGLDKQIVQPIRLCWSGTAPNHRIAARIVDGLDTVALDRLNTD